MEHVFFAFSRFSFINLICNSIFCVIRTNELLKRRKACVRRNETEGMCRLGKEQEAANLSVRVLCSSTGLQDVLG